MSGDGIRGARTWSHNLGPGTGNTSWSKTEQIGFLSFDEEYSDFSQLPPFAIWVKKEANVSDRDRYSFVNNSWIIL
jgi:hypothetical protein